jgi:hypothetical protein
MHEDTRRWEILVTCHPRLVSRYDSDHLFPIECSLNPSTNTGMRVGRGNSRLDFDQSASHRVDTTAQIAYPRGRETSV